MTRKLPTSPTKDCVRVIEHGYDLVSSERERNAQLASLHAAAFPSPKGTFAFTYRFDVETGAIAPDFDSLAYTDWAPEPLFPAVMSLAARYPGSINAFYGGLNVASMTQRFAEVGTLPADFGAAIEETYRPFGIRDFYACCATNLDGHGILLAAATDGVASIPIRTRRLWSEVAAHLAAGVRLRNALRGTTPLDGAEAVVEPAGRLVHAEGPAREAGAQEALRQAAIAMDRARTRAGRADAERAVAAWRALVEGRWSLLDHFDSDGRRYLVAQENEPATRTIRTLTPRERQVALYAAQGHSNKLIGYELGLSEGTVKAHLARAMGKLGFESRSRLASLLASSTSADRASSTTFGTERIEVRSGPVPEPPSGLSPAEAAIFDGILGGADTATLAEARGVSRKTIGNQLSGLYRKLGVASSAELLARYGAPHRPPGE